MVGAILDALKHEWEIVREGGMTWISAALLVLFVPVTLAWGVKAALNEEAQRQKALVEEIQRHPVDLECRDGIRMERVPAGSYRLSGVVQNSIEVVRPSGGITIVSLKACRRAER